MKTRCVAKLHSTKPKRWAVYDVSRGGWPVQVPGFGRVAGPFKTEPEAEAEADRLADHYQKEGILWGRTSTSSPAVQA